MCCMPLLTRRQLIRSQDRINEWFDRVQNRASPNTRLTLRRNSVRNRLTDLATMDTKLASNTLHSTYAELVFATQLFKQFHFGSPTHKGPPCTGRIPNKDDHINENRWARFLHRSGPDHYIKRRCQCGPAAGC